MKTTLCKVVFVCPKGISHIWIIQGGEGVKVLVSLPGFFLHILIEYP
jgi:hypothetical protein